MSWFSAGFCVAIGMAILFNILTEAANKKP
jgi:hypothetical protein